MENTNRWLEEVNGELSELRSRISEGEHQEQDFKFRIDSSRKIAITLCAFANSDGGRLLIGVKDNGRIAGIDPEEEYYMIEGAANMYCRPALKFETTVYEDEEGKKVLEIFVPSSPLKPHQCQGPESEQWLAYIRQDDENFKVNRVILHYLKDSKASSKAKNLIAYGAEERLLFDFLSANDEISLSKFARLSGLSIAAAEEILINFLKWDIIHYHCGEKGVRFRLNPDPIV